MLFRSTDGTEVGFAVGIAVGRKEGLTNVTDGGTTISTGLGFEVVIVIDVGVCDSCAVGTGVDVGVDGFEVVEI